MYLSIKYLYIYTKQNKMEFKELVKVLKNPKFEDLIQNHFDESEDNYFMDTMELEIDFDGYNGALYLTMEFGYNFRDTSDSDTGTSGESWISDFQISDIVYYCNIIDDEIEIWENLELDQQEEIEKILN